ncbi:type II toxin-antitoxin system VapC family toxin [Falsiroseomonas sp. HW251]|uniref:type II toxin-antitoxin system VapC family toxin n=1 Tax=Falsiroseomonas sp. HW251 TaxID=3390998 RepID=UPI003D3197D4
MSDSKGIVLDSSVLLAAVLKERGGEALERLLAEDAQLVMSSVNFAETIAVLVRRHGISARKAREDLLSLTVSVLPFGVEDAEPTALLHAAHRGVLSLGDAACLATAMREGLPVLTADRPWTTLGLDLDIRLIR